MITSYQNREFLEDLFSNLLDETLEWIQNKLSPEDVFDKDKLEEWARDNGFIHTSEIED